MVSQALLFSLLYNVPLFGLACFGVYCRRRESKQLLSLMSAVDSVVVMLAASRYFGAAIPPSGHALFLTHTLITITNRLYRTLAVMILIMTIALKMSWGDWVQLKVGLNFRRFLDPAETLMIGQPIASAKKP